MKNKKIGIISLLVLGLFLAGCVPVQQVKLGDIKDDYYLGKEISIKGKVLSFALDNYKRGFVKIEDGTGVIYVKPNFGTYGFGELYNGPKFYFEGSGILRKGMLDNKDQYYVEINNKLDYKITET